MKRVRSQQLPEYVFTQAGYDKAKLRYEQLLSDRKPAVEDLRKAREMGDLSENGYYKAARFKLNFIDRELRQLKMHLQYGKIVAKGSSEHVSVGSKVVLSDGQRQITYHIVGEFEANPAEGKLSLVSPVGSALIGKRAGEAVKIIAPSGSVTYTIVDIS